VSTLRWTKLCARLSLAVDFAWVRLLDVAAINGDVDGLRKLLHETGKLAAIFGAPLEKEDFIQRHTEQSTRTGTVSTLERVESAILPSLYALPFYDFDLRASHARTLLPAALASVPFGFVLVRVRRGLEARKGRSSPRARPSVSRGHTP